MEEDSRRAAAKKYRPFDSALILSSCGGRKVLKLDETIWDLWAETASQTFDRRMGNKGKGDDETFRIEFVRLRSQNETQTDTTKQKESFLEDAMQWRYLVSKQPTSSREKLGPPSPSGGISPKRKLLPPLGVDLSTDFEDSSSPSDVDNEQDIAVLTGFESRVMKAIWEMANPRGSLGDEVLQFINSKSRKQGMRPLGRFQLIETLRSLMRKHMLKQTSVSAVVKVKHDQRSLNLYGSKVLRTRAGLAEVLARETTVLIPNRFDLLTSLRCLAVKDCCLTHVPSTISTLTMLRSLSLSDNSIRSVPAEIFERCLCLESVVLNNNRISTLPRIDKLQKLKLLWLSSNSLQRLPEGIETLSDLEDLCANDNRIESLPKDLNNLRSLKRLSMAKNRIELMPRTIGALTRLEHLDLQRNKLSGKLPDSLGCLERLRRLLLAHNEISELHSTVGRMRSLKDLVMTGNQLKGLPESVLYLTQLTELRLLENPLEEPKDGNVWKLDESTEVIAKEKINRRVAKRSSMALSRDALIKASGLKARV